MPTARKILGQSKPAATTDATLYTVPGSTDTVVSSIVIAESNGASATFRICVDAGGGTTTVVGKAVAWTVTIPANSVMTFNLGMTLAAGATIVIQASTANLTFTAFGQENT